jgi:hypothetical protein
MTYWPLTALHAIEYVKCVSYFILVTLTILVTDYRQIDTYHLQTGNSIWAEQLWRISALNKINMVNKRNATGQDTKTGRIGGARTPTTSRQAFKHCRQSEVSSRTTSSTLQYSRNPTTSQNATSWEQESELAKKIQKPPPCGISSNLKIRAKEPDELNKFSTANRNQKDREQRLAAY